MRQIIFRGPAMRRITIDLVRSSITPIGLRPRRGGFLLLRGEFEFSARTGTHEQSIRLKTADLVRVSRAKVADIRQEEPSAR